MDPKLFIRIIDRLDSILSNVSEDHGVYHCITVLDHAESAMLEMTDLTDRQRDIIRFACLLHEVDDSKFFSTSNYSNARDILRDIKPDLTEEVIELIDLVSCRKNRNRKVSEGEEWKLIPRDADRLEAIGYVGNYRCYIHNIHTGREEIAEDTDKYSKIEELDKNIEKYRVERFEKYDGYSKSMIDHFYDKILHIGGMNSGNKYLQNEANRRMELSKRFVVDYNK